jgi:glucose/arabinose dehydrogenase
LTMLLAMIVAAASAAADWRDDAPGKRHLIRSTDLPAPFATAAAANPPTLVARPAGADLKVPAGFKVERLIAGLDNPRVLRIAPNGDIFVAETAAGRIRVLRPAATSATLAQIAVYASGLDEPFGMAFYPSGNQPQWLYVANNNSVVRFAYQSGDLKARSQPELIVPQLARTSGGHSTRDIVFAPDGQSFYVSIGSASNVATDLPALNASQLRQHEQQYGQGAAWGSELQRADVLQFGVSGTPAARSFATGIRNCVGMAVHSLSGDLWCAVNERDGLGDDLVPDYVTRVKAGAFYGWPWFYLGANADPRHQRARPDLRQQVTTPDVLLAAHSAALGVVEYRGRDVGASFPAEYAGDLLVALHGSWNRSQRTGYKVVRVRLKAGVPTGEYEDFMTGFVVDNTRVWGRPVGIAVANDGALLVSDDGSNSIWRVSYSGP